jgi:hypothetical protein
MLESIRSFNRFELKYLLSLEKAEEFKQDIKSFVHFDHFSKEKGFYPIRSLYFDSKELSCYWEKIEGLKFRRKLRIRSYGNGEQESDAVFVEVKQRVNRVTQKRRIELPYQEAMELVTNDQFWKEDSSFQSFIEEVQVFRNQYQLIPQAVVQYNREALVGGSYDEGLRITFDRSIESRLNNLELTETDGTSYILPPSQCIMEIKVNDRIPYWLTEKVAKHELRMIRVSKYCRAIEKKVQGLVNSHLGGIYVK